MKKIKAYSMENKYLWTIPFILPLIFYLHYVNAFAFSFTDAYNSFARAYFMLNGRELYSEIFSHHNMLMVYFSYVIQKLVIIESLYSLILIHQMAIALFSMIMALLLIVRFKWPAFGFILVIEITKYYLFGNLFLAESIVMYLLAYLLGLSWDKLNKKEISRLDIILGGIFVFLTVFFRETFIPPAVILYAYLIFDKKYLRTKAITIFIMAVFSVLLIISVNIQEYFFHLITLNFSGYIQNELAAKGSFGLIVLKIFFYPVYVLISGSAGEFRIIQIYLSLSFLTLFIFTLKNRDYLKALMLFMILGLTNIRFSIPGDTLYDAFHSLPWFGLFIFSIFLMLHDLKGTSSKLVRNGVLFLCFLVILTALLPPFSVSKRNISIEEEFTTNYARFYVSGEVVRRLSDPIDRLMVDEWDTLIYWQSGLDSSYKYAMYFPVMSNFEKYTKEREEMFVNDPPEFYYFNCRKDRPVPLAPELIKKYFYLMQNNKQTCLLIHNSKLPEISEDKWKSVEEFGYSR